MLNKTAIKILELFFYLGMNRLQTSQIIRRTGYDFKTVKKYLDKLRNLGLIVKYRDLKTPTYGANFRNKYFLNIKREKILNDIFLSGLPKYFNNKLGEKACIIFGSCARGDFYEDSDIDVYVQSGRINIKVDNFEKLLKRKISFFFEKRWQNLNKGMKTGLLNDGIAINGRLKL